MSFPPLPLSLFLSSILFSIHNGASLLEVRISLCVCTLKEPKRALFIILTKTDERLLYLRSKCVSVYQRLYRVALLSLRMSFFGRVHTIYAAMYEK